MSEGGREEVQARYTLAKQYQSNEKYKEATEEFVWLWKNIPTQDPPMSGVRGSFMAHKMKQLAQKYAPARNEFVKLRVAAELSNDRFDWLVLSEILDAEQEVIDWFDEVKELPDATKQFAQVDYRLEKLLITKNRWADITNYLYKDPFAKLQTEYQHFQQHQQWESTQDRKDLPEYNPFRDTAGKLYASLLAAGLTKLADQVAEQAIKMSDSLMLRIDLVRCAHDARQSVSDSLKWIASAVPGAEGKLVFGQLRIAAYTGFKRYDLALKECNNLIRIAPEMADIHQVRGGLLMELGRNAEALTELNQALDNNPTAPAQALTVRALIYCKLGNSVAAILDTDRAIELDPNLSWSYAIKSKALYQQGMFQHAYETAAKSIDLDPLQIDGLAQKAKAAFRLGNFDDALEECNKWIEGDSNRSGEGHYYRALVYESVGKPELGSEDRNVAKKLGFNQDESN